MSNRKQEYDRTEFIGHTVLMAMQEGQHKRMCELSDRLDKLERKQTIRVDSIAGVDGAILKMVVHNQDVMKYALTQVETRLDTLEQSLGAVAQDDGERFDMIDQRVEKLELGVEQAKSIALRAGTMAEQLGNKKQPKYATKTLIDSLHDEMFGKKQPEPAPGQVWRDQSTFNLFFIAAYEDECELFDVAFLASEPENKVFFATRDEIHKWRYIGQIEDLIRG